MQYERILANALLRVAVPAGFDTAPIPKHPHEDVDSMRVIGPADTDAMRVNPSPNDPTLAGAEVVLRSPPFGPSTAQQLVDDITKSAGLTPVVATPREAPTFSWPMSPSEVEFFKPGGLAQQWIKGVMASSGDEPPASPASDMDAAEISKILEDIIEADFRRAIDTPDPDFDLDRYAERNKAHIDAIWKRALDRAFSKKG